MFLLGYILLMPLKEHYRKWTTKIANFNKFKTIDFIEKHTIIFMLPISVFISSSNFQNAICMLNLFSV